MEGRKADRPGFAYTVGLLETFRHPEIIIFGLSAESMHAILNNCGDMIRKGERFEADTTAAGVIAKYDVRFRAVTDPASFAEYLGYGCRHYGEERFGLLQCVWPDKAGRFPGEADAAEFLASRQPLPP